MPKILLVDDMKNFLNLQSSFLQRTSSSVIMAKTGAEAVKKAKAEQPDIIMLDIEMPELNGIEACRLLKHAAATKDIPVVMVTTLAKRREECFSAGCNAFLTKPITEELFLETIQKFIPLQIRGLRRVPVNLQVHAFCEDKASTCYTKDLSEKGMFLICDEHPSLGSEINVEFALPDKASTFIKTLGIIVRTVEPDNPHNLLAGVGVELIELIPKERAALASFVETYGE